MTRRRGRRREKRADNVGNRAARAETVRPPSYARLDLRRANDAAGAEWGATRRPPGSPVVVVLDDRVFSTTTLAEPYRRARDGAWMIRVHGIAAEMMLERVKAL